jgi:hypothetical protein
VFCSRVGFLALYRLDFGPASGSAKLIALREIADDKSSGESDTAVFGGEILARG